LPRLGCDGRIVDGTILHYAQITTSGRLLNLEL